MGNFFNPFSFTLGQKKVVGGHFIMTFQHFWFWPYTMKRDMSSRDLINEGANPLLCQWHWLLGRWAGDRAHLEEQMAHMGRQMGMMAHHGDRNMA